MVGFRREYFPFLDSGLADPRALYRLLRDEDKQVIQVHDKPVYTASLEGQSTVSLRQSKDFMTSIPVHLSNVFERSHGCW